MSSIYINEPLTNGKILLVTTLGDIDVELWSKEAPMACRNFVQLCMEGYYNGTIFHRIIKDFVAQGGDPSGTGQGGESAYGKTFKDEFHQRLRFVRRGLVAMANGGPNDNGSQFFFTLGRCDELNKKNTIFGKVTGNTVFNMIRFNEILTDKDDRPIGEPPKIIKTEVLSNPFSDIVPRDIKRKVKSEKLSKPKSQSKATKRGLTMRHNRNSCQRTLRDFSLLSFGEEAVEDEEEVTRASSTLKIKSSHDLLKNDPKLSAQPAIDDYELEENRRANEAAEDNGEEVGDSEFDAEMASKVREKLKRSATGDRQTEDTASKDSIEDVFSYNRSKKRKKALQQESMRLKKEMLEAKRRREEELRGKKEAAEDRSILPKAVQEFRTKQDYYRDVKLKGSVREEATMKLLADFRSRVMSAKVKKATAEDGEDEGKKVVEEQVPPQEQMPAVTGTEPATASNEDWMSHQLVFEDDRIVKAKDVNAVTSEDTYDIFDPRNPINMRRREEQAVPVKKKKVVKHNIAM